MITRNMLYVRKNGSNYGYHLQTNNVTGNPPIMVRKNGSNFYCPTFSGTSVLNIRKNGNNYYAADLVPIVDIAWHAVYDPQPYMESTRVDSFTISMRNGVAFNGSVHIYAAIHSWSSYDLIATLPAGSTYASTGGFRLASLSFYAYVNYSNYIGESTNNWWDGWASFGVPEHLWGV